MFTKDETAQLLADAHFRLDQSISRIFRVTETDESNSLKAVKLLEVNPMTTETGIMPVALMADPSRGVFYPVVIIEVSPEEFGRVTRGELRLPHDWRMADELLPSQKAAGAAS